MLAEAVTTFYAIHVTWMMVAIPVGVLLGVGLLLAILVYWWVRQRGRK